MFLTFVGISAIPGSQNIYEGFPWANDAPGINLAFPTSEPYGYGKCLKSEGNASDPVGQGIKQTLCPATNVPSALAITPLYKSQFDIHLAQ